MTCEVIPDAPRGPFRNLGINVACVDRADGPAWHTCHLLPVALSATIAASAIIPRVISATRCEQSMRLGAASRASSSTTTGCRRDERAVAHPAHREPALAHRPPHRLVGDSPLAAAVQR